MPDQSFSRILTLAGVLTEDMTPQQAGNLLRANGFDTRNPSDHNLRQIMQGKNPQAQQALSNAYRIFMPQDTTAPPGAPPTRKPEWKQAPNENLPVWAQGLRDARIRKEDYTDANFVRKSIWELAGKPTNHPITLWSFDGQRFNEHLLVFGNASIYKEMAKAMVTLSRNTAKAIFISGASNKMILIYVDGRVLDNPIMLQHQSSNRNPMNDWDFISNLPRKLADITRNLEKGDHEQPSDYKAWINVEDGKIVAFDENKTYYDAIRDHPKDFGAFGARSMLQARIVAERRGWAAVGVNGEKGEIGAIVTAMNAEQALKAARLLFRERYQNGDWNTLKIKTNDATIILKGRNEIRDYLKTGKKPETQAQDDNRNVYI